MPIQETSISPRNGSVIQDHSWSYDPSDRMIDSALILASPELRSVDRTIYPGDEMLVHDVARFNSDWSRASAEYFLTGLALLSTVRQLASWRFGSWANVDSFLDFACGHGRLSRFLIRELDPRRIWVSDIVQSAVEFQETAFGVRGILSTPRPSELVCPRKFDFIFAASLFTHLPEDLFRGWLGKLLDMLKPDGILAFSVHDVFLLPDSELRGHCFAPESESRVLDTAIYGTAWVSEEFVRSALGQDRQVEFRRIHRGLCNYQDLYVVGRDLEDLWPRLTMDPGPLGFLEHCNISGTKLELSGWSAHLVPGRAVESILVYLNGSKVADLRSFSERTDLPSEFSANGNKPVGFQGTVEIPTPRHSTSDVVLLVEAVSDAGAQSTIYLGSLESAVRACLLLQRGFLEARLREQEALFAAEREKLMSEIGAAQRHIEWMRASRFWKMREQWFRLRQLLGLPG